MSCMKICIDYHEKKKIPLFKEYLKSLKTPLLIDEIEVVTAQSGDVYTPDGLVGIERKSEDDFIGSVYNKQLDKQLKELRDNFHYPFLFIEYDGLRDIIMKNIGINPESIVGIIASIMARHKVTVCFVGDFYVPIVCKTISKIYDGKSIMRDQNYTPIRRGYTLKELKLDTIARMPGVGTKKGRQLLDYFDWSIPKIVSADVEEFKKVAGIGKKISQQIKDVFQ